MPPASGKIFVSVQKFVHCNVHCIYQYKCKLLKVFWVGKLRKCWWGRWHRSWREQILWYSCRWGWSSQSCFMDIKLLYEVVFFWCCMVLLLVMMLEMLQRLEKMNLMILLLMRIWLTRLFCIHLATFWKLWRILAKYGHKSVSSFTYFGLFWL